MSPFDVLVQEVPDAHLEPLLTALAAYGYANPVITPIIEDSFAEELEPLEEVSPTSVPAVAAPIEPPLELPEHWTLVEERSGQSYRWPEPPEPELYTRYAIYETRTAREGRVRMAIGWAQRAKTWGKD